MLKIHNTVLAAMTFLTLSMTASANDKGREPCSNSGNENLQIMNVGHLDMVDKTVDGLARSNTIFSSVDVRQFCKVIEETNSGPITRNQVLWITKTYKISKEDFFEKYIDFMHCGKRNLVFYTFQTYGHDDFESFMDMGLEINRPLKSYDGTYMTALDSAMKYFKSSEGKEKTQWRILIAKMKRNGAKTCEQLGRSDCILVEKV